MPLERVHKLPSPFQRKRQANTGLKKRCVSPSRKPGGNDRDRAGAVSQAFALHCLCRCMEGLFYLMASPLLSKGMPSGVPFLFALKEKGKIEQDSGGSAQDRFIKWMHTKRSIL
jgi:hypothetical protein